MPAPTEQPFEPSRRAVALGVVVFLLLLGIPLMLLLDAVRDGTRGRDASTRSRAPSAEVVVRCARDGSITVSTPVVAAHRDGVHVLAEMEAYRRTWLKGLDVSVKGHRVTTQSPAAPGTTSVSCLHDSAPTGFEFQSAELLIVDPEGHWVPEPTFACAGRAGANWAGATPKPGPPDEGVRRLYADLIRGGDETVISGYPGSAQRRFHIVRKGHSVFAVDLWTSAAGWETANSEFCT